MPQQKPLDLQTETTTKVTTVAEAETFENNQSRRVFVKSMPGGLRSKLMERPATDKIHDLCTFAGRQITIPDMCRKDNYPEDGSNQIESHVSDTLYKVLCELAKLRKIFNKK